MIREIANNLSKIFHLEVVKAEEEECHSQYEYVSGDIYNLCNELGACFTISSNEDEEELECAHAGGEYVRASVENPTSLFEQFISESPDIARRETNV
jgi:hypothetical protein